MAEVINFFDRLNKRNSEIEDQKEVDFDEDIVNAKIVSKEVFYETMMLLEDLGYDVNEDPKMLKDLEAISFLSSAIIFRAHNNPHPGRDLLDATYEVLLAVSKLYEDLSEEEENAQTDSSL